MWGCVDVSSPGTHTRASMVSGNHYNNMVTHDVIITGSVARRSGGRAINLIRSHCALHRTRIGRQSTDEFKPENYYTYSRNIILRYYRRILFRSGGTLTYVMSGPIKINCIVQTVWRYQQSDIHVRNWAVLHPCTLYAIHSRISVKIILHCVGITILL